ncbi:predicted protein [Postia placenta Mad-698-R]|nr:predicted protein [Postia placenta Mad-698-R]
MKARYCQATRDLVDTDNGWHFSALHASATQVLDFRIEDMASKMQSVAPELCDLIGALLVGGESRGLKWSTSDEDEEGALLDTDEIEYWSQLGDDPPVWSSEVSGGEANKRAQIVAQRRNALTRVKAVVILSIVMQSLSQRCNALAAVNGILFHSCNTPDRVIKCLAHMGLSISPSAINYMVHSLSVGSALSIRSLGQSLLAGLAYDNFNILLNTMTPTIEKSMENLLHLTSGMILPLYHGVTREDMRCSHYLWERSPLNPPALMPSLGMLRAMGFLRVVATLAQG